MTMNLATKINEFSLAELEGWVDDIVAGGGGGTSPGSFTTLASSGVATLGGIISNLPLGSAGARTDAQMQFSSPNSTASALIVGFQRKTLGTTTAEVAFCGLSYDGSGGGPQQLGSYGMRWADATASTGYSVCEIHANYGGGGSSATDFRIYGNHGIEIFGGALGAGPGAGVMQVNGILELAAWYMRTSSTGGTTYGRYGSDVTPRADFSIWTQNMSALNTTQDDAAKPSWSLTLDGRVAGDAVSLSHMAAGGAAVEFLGISKLGIFAFAGALTVTAQAVNTKLLSSTGYSLTGSNATNGIDIAGTWNTSGTPTAFKYAITNTASNAASLLMSLLAGAGGVTSMFSVNVTGEVVAASSVTTGTPNGGTAGAWKFGIRVAATVILDTTQYIQLDVGGTLYKVAIAT